MYFCENKFFIISIIIIIRHTHTHTQRHKQTHTHTHTDKGGTQIYGAMCNYIFEMNYFKKNL